MKFDLLGAVGVCQPDPPPVSRVRTVAAATAIGTAAALVAHRSPLALLLLPGSRSPAVTMLGVVAGLLFPGAGAAVVGVDVALTLLRRRTFE